MTRSLVGAYHSESRTGILLEVATEQIAVRDGSAARGARRPRGPRGDETRAAAVRAGVDV